jgi:hypothetical protein
LHLIDHCRTLVCIDVLSSRLFAPEDRLQFLYFLYVDAGMERFLAIRRAFGLGAATAVLLAWGAVVPSESRASCGDYLAHPVQHERAPADGAMQVGFADGTVVPASDKDRRPCRPRRGTGTGTWSAGSPGAGSAPGTAGP